MKQTKIPRHHIRSKVDIIGHKHPDTDSVCSALAYAWLKNQTGDTEYEARCAGSINHETAFVLDYWGVDAPRLCTDVRPQIKDVEFRLQPGISPNMSIRDAWTLMRDEAHTLTGLVALKDIANASMDLFDTNTLSSAHTSYVCYHTVYIVAERSLCKKLTPDFSRNPVFYGIMIIISPQSGGLHYTGYFVLTGLRAGCLTMCWGGSRH